MDTKAGKVRHKGGLESYKGRQGKVQMQAREGAQSDKVRDKGREAGQERHTGRKKATKAGKERHKGRQ